MLPNLENKACEHCGRWPNRPLSVDMVSVKEDTVLLIKRTGGIYKTFKEYWALPGGHVEYNETLEDTVRREVKEEVGLEVVKSTLLNVYGNPERSPNQGVTIAYIIEVTGSMKAGDDAQAIKYFPLHDLPELAFDHRKIIEDYINTQK